jgi:hypothetical protein
LFSAIIGRFLTSVAAWRLERGVDVASIEYLLGSRTVFGTLATPFRLRIVHFALPMLIILWTLSPLGSQGSLRVVSSGAVSSNATATVYYLSSISPWWMGASDTSTFGSTVNAIFASALIAPQSSKDAPQDVYGNLKVPLLEHIREKSSDIDADGWYSVKTGDILVYSSLIGLPTAGIAATDRTSLAIESSYLYPHCTLSVYNISEPQSWQNSEETWCNNRPAGYMAIDLNLDHGPQLYRPYQNVTTPRTIQVYLLGTVATCVLTTGYVETRFTCNSHSCESTAIRQSTLKHHCPEARILDGLHDNEEVTTWA